MTLYRLAFFLFVLGCGSPAPVQRPATPNPETATEATDTSDWRISPDQDPLRFRNDEGVRAYLIPLRSNKDPELRGHYLFQITGSSSKYDGLVVLVQREVQRYGVAYFAFLDGSPKRLLFYEKPLSGNKGEPIWHLFGYEHLSKLGKLIAVHEPFDAEAILELREQQQGQEISKFETRDRESVIKAIDRQHQEHLAGTIKLCGPIESSIDWSTIPDVLNSKYSIAHACSVHLTSMREFCSYHPGRMQSEGKPPKLSCAFDEKYDQAKEQTMRMDASGTFIFDAVNASDRHRERLQFLREHYGEESLAMQHGSKIFVVRFRGPHADLFYGESGVFHPIGVSTEYRGRDFLVDSGGTKGYLQFKDHKWTLKCDEKPSHLATLDRKARDALVASAQFKAEPKWKRTPYFLARDSKGSYYYVDRYKRLLGGGRYRVFVGRKGQLQLSKLKRLVEDSEGTLFSTARGDLRLVVNAGAKSGVWIKGKKVTPLTSVNVNFNRRLIYDELGVYYGEKLGFPCE